MHTTHCLCRGPNTIFEMFKNSQCDGLIAVPTLHLCCAFACFAVRSLWLCNHSLWLRNRFFPPNSVCLLSAFVLALLQLRCSFVHSYCVSSAKVVQMKSRMQMTAKALRPHCIGTAIALHRHSECTA